MCTETTKLESTVAYLDALFNLSDPLTHWTLGNHDTRNGNIEFITNRTKRNTFYTVYENGMTIMLLNLSLGHVPALEPSCDLRDEQYKMMLSVFDSIENSSHLIVFGSPGGMGNH